MLDVLGEGEGPRPIVRLYLTQGRPAWLERHGGKEMYGSSHFPPLIPYSLGKGSPTPLWAESWKVLRFRDLFLLPK